MFFHKPLQHAVIDLFKVSKEIFPFIIVIEVSLERFYMVEQSGVLAQLGIFRKLERCKFFFAAKKFLML